MIKISLPNPPFDFSTDSSFVTKLKEELSTNEKCALAMPKKKFTFSLYKDPRIKDSLVKVFYGKCAYCDSSLRHISYGDIDHFRPKSKYWWLAADWKNLLLACPRCNSSKRDKFPLSKDSNAAYGTHRSFDEVEKMEKSSRQLLHPYLDEPEKCIIYEENDEPVIKMNLDKKINKSVVIYDLNRIELVQERFKTKKLVLDQINRTILALMQYNPIAEAPMSLQKEIREHLFKELDLLLSYLKPSQPYLGLCRQLIIPFLNRYSLKNNI